MFPTRRPAVNPRETDAAGGTAGTRADRAFWRRSKRRVFLVAIPITFVANSLIAGFLWVLIREDFWSGLVVSHAIGWSILFLHLAIHLLDREHRLPDWLVTAVSVPAGAVVGVLLSRRILGAQPWPPMDVQSLSVTAACVLVFGVGMSHFFVSRARLAEGAARLEEELLAREEAARRLAEAELKLLQAQIEPHFLFNTLSNVLQLVDADPPRAKKMLHNLTSYLRGSLGRTRAGATTLGEELDLVRAYLEIQAVRMGSRLTWRISCPDDVRHLTLPPLLLQPLVENALRHGLEPKPGGGEVSVSAARERDELVLEVRDDGLGLDPRRPAGVGLTNVRERVRALSGGRGSLTLRPAEAGGLCARIALPLDASPPPARAAGGPA
jgi:signal transduction histidine kinase